MYLECYDNVIKLLVKLNMDTMYDNIYVSISMPVKISFE